jgi:hypothetical protein
MDWLTFISEIIKAIAWPATLIVLLVIVRKDLPALIRSLRKLKFKGVEFEFDAAAKQVAADAKSALPPPSTNPPILLRKSHTRPMRGEILEAWLIVEAAARNLLRRNAREVDAKAAPYAVSRALAASGLLEGDQVAIFEQLRVLRNEAVHATDMRFTSQAVEDYVDSALALTDYLEALARSPSSQ